MRRIMLLAVVAALSGCVTTPKDRAANFAGNCAAHVFEEGASLGICRGDGLTAHCRRIDGGQVVCDCDGWSFGFGR